MEFEIHESREQTTVGYTVHFMRVMNTRRIFLFYSFFFQNHSNFFFQRKREFRQKLKSAAFFLSEIQNSNQNIPHNRKEFGDTMLF